MAPRKSSAGISSLSILVAVGVVTLAVVVLLLSSSNSVSPVALRGQSGTSEEEATPSVVPDRDHGACYDSGLCDVMTARECKELRYDDFPHQIENASDSCYKKGEGCYPNFEWALDHQEITLAEFKQRHPDLSDEHFKDRCDGGTNSSYLSREPEWQACWDEINLQAAEACSGKDRNDPEFDLGAGLALIDEKICRNGRGQSELSNNTCTIMCEGYFTCLPPEPSGTPEP